MLTSGRSGIAITSTFTIRQCSRLLKVFFLYTFPANLCFDLKQKVENDPDYQEIRILRERLISKTKVSTPPARLLCRSIGKVYIDGIGHQILDPAIDMIDLM